MRLAPRRQARFVPPVTVPRLWPGSTIVCLGTGPSLMQADVDFVRGKARVIAVNDAYKLAPWADVLYACDSKWWGWHKGAPTFPGLKYTLQAPAVRWPGVQMLRNAGQLGLELRPDGVRTGQNSGYQAINLAVHLGAARILLLGYDMQGNHFFGSHPDQSKPPFSICLERFKTLAPPLKAQGITVLNCTRKTALKCFPCVPLEQALATAREEVAS